MKPISEIRALFNVIKTETRRWFNTGARIDEVGQAILDHIENLEQGTDNFWQVGEGDILQPKDNKTFTLKKAYEVDPIAGTPTKFLNEQGDFVEIVIPTPTTAHPDLTDKNAEPNYQHIDTTTTKQTLVEDDKVAIYDSITGKVVLTDKANVGGGSTDIISANATNNTGTIVIDTTPNWQRVNISSGSNTLILDYENGVLPTKNREYLLVIDNSHTYTKILTFPTDSIIKNGITYNFKNTAVSVPNQAGRSIEVNVIFFFINATTCNIRTQITQFI